MNNVWTAIGLLFVAAAVAVGLLVTGWALWNGAVYLLAWRLQRKERNYLQEAQDGYEKVLNALYKLGWITRNQQDDMNFNFFLVTQRSYKAEAQLKVLNANLEGMLVGLKESVGEAQDTIDALVTADQIDYNEVAYAKSEYDEFVLPVMPFTLFPEMKDTWPPGPFPPGTELSHDFFGLKDRHPEWPLHKHHFKLLSVRHDQSVGPNNIVESTVYAYRCDRSGCGHEFFATPEFFWGGRS